MKTILVLNTGSSSVKASLLSNGSDESHPTLRIFTAHAERLKTPNSTLHISILVEASKLIVNETGIPSQLASKGTLQLPSRKTSQQKDHVKTNELDNNGYEERENPTVETFEVTETNMSHKKAIDIIIEKVRAFSPKLMDSVVAVGHRVVHGGTESNAVIVTHDVLSRIQNVSYLAPLHNPANLQGIQIALEIFQNVPSIAVFDTAFHSTMLRHVHTLPLPKEYTNRQIRKYGFHGTSVKFVTQHVMRMLQPNMAMRELPQQPPLRLIIAHLGNGASVTAVVDGKSVDTTMEFTPLSGIMMGTRCGSIDPSIVTYASKHMNKTPEEVLSDLNKESGLRGVSGGDNDMRTVISRSLRDGGDEDAQLALDMFVHILAKHIAGLIVSCGDNIDALVFTAGIGEHSGLIRKLTVAKLAHLLGNVELDNERNEQNGKYSDGIISLDHSSSCVVMVVPTDEEVMICHECERLLNYAQCP